MAEARQLAEQRLADVQRRRAKIEAEHADSDEKKLLLWAQLVELEKQETILMVTAVREAVTQVLDKRLPTNETQPFSKVSKSAAYQVLGQLGLLTVVGELTDEELEVPEGTPFCSEYNRRAEDGRAETPALLRHHKQQLELLGVKMGLNGFAVYDVHDHTFASLVIQVDDTEYEGIFDGCVAPYGLTDASAIIQCRIIYEYKKQAGALEEFEGQIIMKLLAASAYAPSPVLLDVTDGVTHNLCTLRGRELIMWTGLAPTTAYYMQARHLQSLPNLTKRALTLEEIPEPQQGWLRRLHEKLQPPCALQE
ncbi:hypothetical protein GPECTOR_16g770 [Gonium pectorale]|uniref:Uncharacterized protein n=1 Tax=Gonium pectorale TaxID=33097 RepID=A0A150GLI1_GONPE|nr:hypothetical protein GPECTOR_16g770 [Gonium pectorale]|eukprot:KXZ50595.1 hypothetical protein GPECTOR_16g770 [Gonium pectorale]